MVGGLAPLRGDDGGIVATHRWKPSAHEARIPPGDRGIYGTFGTLRYDYGRRGGMHMCGESRHERRHLYRFPNGRVLGFQTMQYQNTPAAQAANAR